MAGGVRGRPEGELSGGTLIDLTLYLYPRSKSWFHAILHVESKANCLASASPSFHLQIGDNYSTNLPYSFVVSCMEDLLSLATAIVQSHSKLRKVTLLPDEKLS